LTTDVYIRYDTIEEFNVDYMQ